jgi:hypothetical protein
MSDDQKFKLQEQPVCSVMMDGDVHVSDDFIAILSDETGKTSIMYNTDAMTLGMAIKLIAHAYLERVRELSEDEQSSIVAILGPEFTAENLAKADDVVEPC